MMPSESLLEESEYLSSEYEPKSGLVYLFFFSSLFVQLNRNSASSLIKQKLIFAGTERGKLLALRQSFQEVLRLIILSDCVSVVS